MSITVWRWNVCDLKLCPNAMFRSRTFWEMMESLGSWTNSPPHQWRGEWRLHYERWEKLWKLHLIRGSQPLGAHLSFLLLAFSPLLSASQKSWIPQLSLLYASVSVAFCLYHQPNQQRQVMMDRNFRNFQNHKPKSFLSSVDHLR